MTAEIRDLTRPPHHEPSTEAQVARLVATVDALTQEIHALRNDTQGLVTAWKAASLAVTVIKWVAALGIALVAIKTSWEKLSGWLR